MNVIGGLQSRPFSVKTRTRAMETAEEVRERKVEARKARQENRERAVEIAAAAAHRRGVRNLGTLMERVERAAQRLKGAAAGATVDILNSLSHAEREVYLLAEEHLGANRQEILRLYPPPRAATRDAFAQTVATEVESPEQSVELDPAVEPASDATQSLVVMEPEELLALGEKLGRGDADGDSEAI